MEFFDFFNISERYIELINPLSTEKVIEVGKFLGLFENSRVIEFGSGYGEILIIWAEQFGISGIGIDIREHVCSRAQKKISERGLNDRIEIVCGDGAKYKFEKHSFDIAACIGASFIWEGYKNTIQNMKPAIKPDGKLVIGEPYWQNPPVPQEYLEKVSEVLNEYELLQIARDEGYTFEYIVRSSRDDWDRYETCNWYGLVKWLEENPKHPERQEVIDYLKEAQDDYIKFGREYLGWAVYLLNSINKK